MKKPKFKLGQHVHISPYVAPGYYDGILVTAEMLNETKDMILVVDGIRINHLPHGIYYGVFAGCLQTKFRWWPETAVDSYGEYENEGTTEVGLVQSIKSLAFPEASVRRHNFIQMLVDGFVSVVGITLDMNRLLELKGIAEQYGLTWEDVAKCIEEIRGGKDGKQCFSNLEK